jgi:hypothetical protein
MARALRVANTLDCLFTVLLFLKAGNLEGNPLMGWLLEANIVAFIFVKLIGVAVFSEVLERRQQRWALRAFTVIFTIAAAANAALLVSL